MAKQDLPQVVHPLRLEECATPLDGVHQGCAGRVTGINVTDSAMWVYTVSFPDGTSHKYLRDELQRGEPEENP